MKVKALQYFSDEYLERSKKLSTGEIIEFLESFRELQAAPGASRAISVKIPESLLKAFRNKCALHDVRYQTQIKILMQKWVENRD